MNQHIQISEYMLIPGQFMHQMESWNKLTGLYLAKMLTEKLSGKKINEDNNRLKTNVIPEGKDNSNTSKGIVCQYLAIGRFADFRFYQFNLPGWTKEAVIKFKSYGNLEMFS
ncbi:unnamed protein product [Rhizophagus irregularis]|nr:unnamed protein product [Rhizophagus irregularis]CAB4433221.1 unnamed protein product [Rhizophagus irregularis]